MMNLNPTKNGIRALGDFLDEELKNVDMKQETLVRRMAGVGFKVNVYKVQRLRSGAGTPDGFLLRGLARTQFLRDPSGVPYSLDDLMDIACGELQPGEPAKGPFGVNLSAPPTE